jgi:hypothetical protein
MLGICFKELAAANSNSVPALPGKQAKRSSERPLKHPNTVSRLSSQWKVSDDDVLCQLDPALQVMLDRPAFRPNQQPFF